MSQINSRQKKSVLMSYIYAAIVALLVIAAAVTVAVVSANKNVDKAPIVNNPTTEVGGGDTGGNVEVEIPVSTPSFVVPMSGATVSKDYSGKELQYNDTLKQWEIHKAIDFLASDNLNVYALTDATVTNVYNNYLEGNVVEISHSNGLVSVYKSLASTNVKVGDKVTSGQTIGEAGTTMASELNVGAHLHFEVLLDGVKVDPNNYIDLGAK